MSCCILGCPNLRGMNIRKDMTYHSFPHPTKELSRFEQWLKACNNPKVVSKDPLMVYKCYRICRRHFDSTAFNGGCRRLLKTAVPTLHLNLKTEKLDEASTEVAMETELEPTDASFIAIASPSDQPKTSESSKLEKSDEMSELREKLFSEKKRKYMYLNNIHKRHNKRVAEQTTKQKEEAKKEAIMEQSDDYETDVMNYELLDVEETLFSKPPLSEDVLNQWRSDFYKCEKNVLAQNVCSRTDPFEACLSRKVLEHTQHVFTYKVESEGKPLTNQKSSGRCWLFAALNSIRIPFMKQYNLDEFEFSQGYLFYWDKIERCHYFLNNVIETALKGEQVTGRLVSFLLTDPTCDGGQWDMLVNLINKHGLVPKKCFPETFSCETSHRLNAVLKSKLREYAKVLRDLIDIEATEDQLKTKLIEQMGEIYRIVGICLGIPDEKFKWEYYDKSKSYQCIGPTRPIDFYEKYVKPVFNVDDKVCIVNDPRSTSQYGQAYTVECLGNVVGGRPVLYNNQPVELLMDLVTTSLKNSEPVWFGCEVSKRFAAKYGIEDLTVHDFKILFGVDIQITMPKADRLVYGESAMTHAMNFTAVSCDDNGQATKFRVENSWGEDRGEKGYLIMSSDWFKEFVFEVVVDKSIVPKEVLQVFEQNPIVLPAWDPMGTLART